jgi:hypothetical protein
MDKPLDPFSPPTPGPIPWQGIEAVRQEVLGKKKLPARVQERIENLIGVAKEAERDQDLLMEIPIFSESLGSSIIL